MSCKDKISFKRAAICSGNFDKKITLQYAVTTGTSDIGVQTTLEYQDIGNFWAAVKTKPTTKYVDDVNIEDSISTEFYIDYYSGIDIKKSISILYDGKRFKVSSPENINEDDLILKFTSIERGLVTKESTKT